jgi:hypothetical protein
VSNFPHKLRDFVDQYCAQYALLGLQFLWTSDVEAALDGLRNKKGAAVVRELAAKTSGILATLSSWCLQDLGSQMNRCVAVHLSQAARILAYEPVLLFVVCLLICVTLRQCVNDSSLSCLRGLSVWHGIHLCRKKIETLITVQVHHRDVVNDIHESCKARQLTSTDDFEWQKQARFYWNPEGEDAVSRDGVAHGDITDVRFDYQYEFLGTKERLVITPLTDRSVPLAVSARLLCSLSVLSC